MGVALLMVILFGIQEGLKSEIIQKGLFQLLPLDRLWLFFLVIGVFARLRIKPYLFQSAFAGGVGLFLFTFYCLISFFAEGDVGLLHLSWLFTSDLGIAALLSFALSAVKEFAS